LAGLERAQAESGPMRDTLVDHAISRIVLIHSIILTIGGLPLIYLGDEIGMLNDYTYRDDPAKAGDSRWVHRPRANWANVAQRTNTATIEGRLFGRLRQTIKVRLAQPAFTNGAMKVVETRNDHVFGYVRQNDDDCLLVLANFAEQEQTLSANVLRPQGFGPAATDLVSGEPVALGSDLKLEPYQFMCLRP
jgi:amylosucrase